MAEPSCAALVYNAYEQCFLKTEVGEPTPDDEVHQTVSCRKVVDGVTRRPSRLAPVASGRRLEKRSAREAAGAEALGVQEARLRDLEDEGVAWLHDRRRTFLHEARKDDPSNHNGEAAAFADQPDTRSDFDPTAAADYDDVAAVGGVAHDYAAATAGSSYDDSGNDKSAISHDLPRSPMISSDLL